MLLIRFSKSKCQIATLPCQTGAFCNREKPYPYLFSVEALRYVSVRLISLCLFIAEKKSSEDKDPNNLIYLSAEVYLKYYSANNVVIDVWFFKAIFKFCTTKKSFKYQQSFFFKI